ncbi:F-box domain-containing protein [Mycena sanguinolenta]|uniref:F-box domain-containing protein n=1 Tax=Mycena sanguinolenta TaxID=230812 RepID=A0A8H6Z295_9AGAR|nr:F-box domain-containing protein [Mycena sanguinolenta]
MLSELSVELIQEIADKLDKSDYANFRAVCKDLSFAMEPLFFSTIALSRQHLRLKNGQWFLKALASGQAGWSRYAKVLKFSRGNRIEIGEEPAGLSDTVMQELLTSALWSMMSIKTFIWEAHQGVPLWQTNVICDYLCALPSLEDLELIVEDVELPLDRFSRLRSFQITTPYWKECPMVQQVSQLATQCSNLTILHVFGFTDWSELWLTLHRANVAQVKEIYTNVVTDHLLGYLASYCGIEKLSLYRPDIESVAKSDRLANIFFDTVVPQHAESLVKLACSAPYESRWSFGTHNMDLISNLLKLESLEMSVNEDDVVNVEPPLSAVDLLLRTVEHMPALRRLQVFSGVAQTRRNTRHGNPGIKHVNAMYFAITATVKEFRSYNPSAAILCVNGRSYMLKPISTGSIAQENTLFGYFEVPT